MGVIFIRQVSVRTVKLLQGNVQSFCQPLSESNVYEPNTSYHGEVTLSLSTTRGRLFIPFWLLIATLSFLVEEKEEVMNE